MSNFNVDILQIRDSSFNIGFEVGKHIKKSTLLKTFESITKPEVDYKTMESIYSTFAPQLLDELEGLAHGLEISVNRAAAIFSGYDMPRTEALGCSAIMTNDYYVRNYDFSPELYDGIFAMLQPDKSFATAGYNLQLIGRHDGVNERGLVMGLHFVSNHGYTEGISAWTAVRMVLDSCSTADDAIKMLKEIPHAACYNFSIGDENGNMAVVEASPGNVVVRRDLTVLSCVNHFQDKQLANRNRSSVEHSVKRHKHLAHLSGENFQHQDMYNHFKDVHSPVFFTDYEELFGTLHTFSYSYSDSRILTSIARGEQDLDIDFQDWIRGKDISWGTLEGEIN